jgi:hypothetical protein
MRVVNSYRNFHFKGGMAHNNQDEEYPVDLVNYALMSRWQIGLV